MLLESLYRDLAKRPIELRFFFNHEGVYPQLELDVAFGVVLHGWREDCVGLA